MAKATPQHVHKLKRIRYKTGSTIFFCALPDCHFKINTNLALGKRSICWRCGEPFILNEYSLRLSKPHCSACHKPKKSDQEPQEIHPDDVMNEQLFTTPKEVSLSDKLNFALRAQQRNVEAEDEDI